MQPPAKRLVLGGGGGGLAVWGRMASVRRWDGLREVQEILKGG